MTDIPTKEPLEIVAGDTVKWTKSLSDYPASESWVLTYYIKGNGINASAAATADGDDHAVTIAAATTAAWASGDCWMDGYVAKSGERYKVYSAKLVVKPDLSAEDGTFDGRSDAKIMLDAVETAIKALNFSDKSYTLGDRTVTRRDLPELLQTRDRLKGEVYNEQLKERIANGLGSNPRHIGVRFSRP